MMTLLTEHPRGWPRLSSSSSCSLSGVRGALFVYPPPRLQGALLTAKEQAVLAACADALLPAGGPLPLSATEAGVLRYFDDMLREIPPAPSQTHSPPFRLFGARTMDLSLRGRLTSQSPEARVATLRSWSQSRIYFLRASFLSVRTLLAMAYLSNSEVAGQLGALPDLSPFAEEGTPDEARRTAREAREPEPAPRREGPRRLHRDPSALAARCWWSARARAAPSSPRSSPRPGATSSSSKRARPSAPRTSARRRASRCTACSARAGSARHARQRVPADDAGHRARRRLARQLGDLRARARVRPSTNGPSDRAPSLTCAGALDPHYERVENVSRFVAPTPMEVQGERNLRFKRGLRRARLLAASPRHRNVRGCKGSGECFTGCRNGAKQSTDVSLRARGHPRGRARLHQRPRRARSSPTAGA